MPHLYNRIDYISEVARADFQDHDRMVMPTSLELLIRTTELSNIFDAFVTIVSSTWELDYACHPHVLYFDVWTNAELYLDHGDGRIDESRLDGGADSSRMSCPDTGKLTAVRELSLNPRKNTVPPLFCAKPLLALAPYPLPPHQNREMATPVIHPYPP